MAFHGGLHAPDLVEAAALLKEFSATECGRNLRRRCLCPWLHTAVDAGKAAVDWRYLPSSTLGGDTIGYHWIDDDHPRSIYRRNRAWPGFGTAFCKHQQCDSIRVATLKGKCVDRTRFASLNESFQGRQHSNKFFTIWYGVYCSSTRVLIWSGGDTTLRFSCARRAGFGFSPLDWSDDGCCTARTFLLTPASYRPGALAHL
jgi:hypothetical protein